ncbi:HDOD domain-containing protein [Dactylosporangium sp. CA-092794]|uniref:HDOD domain-containing protein n=1 Tax=Dactylosporangium sp. CA-092794 TaxID=3239929 RepID=UPI003D92B17E
MNHRPHIVFVDDDPHILSGLRRMLRAHRHRWDMSFADSGAEALTILDQRPCDVIFSDYRMPVMDGAALLQHVRERHPGTARVILSGQTDENSLVKVMMLAHRFLNKPSAEDQIVGTIEQLVRDAEHGTDRPAGRDLELIDALPSPPRSLHELIEVLDSETSSAASIADVIERDPAVAAKILHLVNSSTYALPRPIVHVAHAVSLLGLQTVRGLVLMHDLVRMLDPAAVMPGNWIDRMTVHAVETSRVARRLAGREEWAGDAFVAGLLHEIGQLVLASSRPAAFAEVLGAWRPEEEPLADLEVDRFGLGHGEIGARLLGLWGLSGVVTDAVAGHGSPAPPAGAHDVASAVAQAHAFVERDLRPVCGRCGD